MVPAALGAALLGQPRVADAQTLTPALVQEKRKDDLKLSMSNIFFSIESSDEELGKGGLLEAACKTWLRHVPPGNAIVYADGAAGVSPACTNRGVRVEMCDPHNATLGENIVSAQLKRERVHFRLQGDLPPDVRWIVSTEQDTWYNVPLLLRYLRSVEHLFPNHAATPFFAGHWWGPFTIFNVAALRDKLGNEAYMSTCKAEMLKCHKREMGDDNCRQAFRIERDGGKDGALYNCDALLRFCARFGVPARAPFGNFKLDHGSWLVPEPEANHCTRGAPPALMIYNELKAGLKALFGEHLNMIPPTLLGLHHIDGDDMAALEDNVPAPPTPPLGVCNHSAFFLEGRCRRYLPLREGESARCQLPKAGPWPCLDWCADIADAWTNKCSYHDTCAGCEECVQYDAMNSMREADAR